MNIHAGIKPYTCKHCPSNFANQSNKIMHEKVAHGGYERSKAKNAHLDDKTAILKEEKPKDLEELKDKNTT